MWEDNILNIREMEAVDEQKWNREIMNTRAIIWS